MEKRVGITDPDLLVYNASIGSSSKKEVVPPSPCELLSPFASKNLIRTNRQHYERDVRPVVQQRLATLPEVAFSYKEEFQSFSCKLSHGSSFRFYEIDIYWDSKNSEHVLDVRRTGGEGFHRFSCDLFTEMSKCFDASYQPRPVQSTSWLTRSIPVSVVEEIDAEIFRTTGVSKEDSFLQGIGNIEALLTSKDAGARIQAMQILCDMVEPSAVPIASASSTLALLTSARCVPRIVSLIQEALNDTVAEVREFAVLAADALVVASPSYQTALGQSCSIISSLLVELQSFTAKEAYLRAHTVRAAARTLVNLSAFASHTVKKEVAVILRCEIEADWLQFVAALSDEQAKNTLSQLTQAIFEKPGFGDIRINSTKNQKNNVFVFSQLSKSMAVEHMKTVFNTLSSSSSAKCQIASSFSEIEVAFYTKVFCRSEVSVFRTSVEYDEAEHECSVEVSRVSGDGTFDFGGRRNASFFFTVRSLSVVDNNKQCGDNVEEVEEELIVGSVPKLTEEQFLIGLGHILALAQDKFASCRMQGLKLLMDTLLLAPASTVSPTLSYLQSPKCASLIVNTLSSLLLEGAVVHGSSSDANRWEELELVLFTIAAFVTFNFNAAESSSDNVYAKMFYPTTHDLLLALLRDTPVVDMDCYRHSLAMRAVADILKAMFSHSECDSSDNASILAEIDRLKR